MIITILERITKDSKNRLIHIDDGNSASNFKERFDIAVKVFKALKSASGNVAKLPMKK